jgi:hydrogenase small subunit
MKISRQDFLKFCGISAAALGLNATDLFRLKEALANPNGPTVIWLQGSACTGCSVSFLNRISTRAPLTTKDGLINSLNLIYHPNLMALAGDSSVAQIEAAYSKGGYVLAVEGGVPTNFGGNACWAWSRNNQDVTLHQAILGLSSKAAAILAVGTCAAFGGIPAAPPNPTGVKSVMDVIGKTTINIAGCPPHPDWIAWVVVQLLLNKPISLDSSGRPTALFNRTVHDRCPKEETEEARTFGVDNRCLEELGCRGKQTRANYPQVWWNGRANRCLDANAPCLGCTNSNFPDLQPFFKSED